MKTVTEMFDLLAIYVPYFVWIIIWCLVLPIRLLVLLCIPPGANYKYHALNSLYDFFAFEGR